jgi:Cysteine-rich CWC
VNDAARCPRCGGAFHCGAADPAPCACSTLALTPALQAALRQRYEGCLCLACLQALARGAPLERAPAAP